MTMLQIKREQACLAFVRAKKNEYSDEAVQLVDSLSTSQKKYLHAALTVCDARQRKKLLTLRRQPEDSSSSSGRKQQLAIEQQQQQKKKKKKTR